MLTVLGAMQEIVPEMITDTLLDEIRHWHIASLFLLAQLHDFWLGFLQKLRAKGITTSLDTNWAPAGDWQRVNVLLPYIDVFLPNENEAMAITGKGDYRSAGMELSKIAKLVVVKRGGEGASAFVNGQETELKVPTFLQKDLLVVDTTGAGDSFDGGFIFEWLQQQALEKCLETGIRCGTASVQKVGGINGQLSGAEYCSKH
jgi:sugar/nucleoside kinase (ribokinase family)